jgi:hypothetical protein
MGTRQSRRHRDPADGFAVSASAFLCCASHSPASISGAVIERLTRPLPNLSAESSMPPRMLVPNLLMGERAKPPVRKGWRLCYAAPGVHPARRGGLRRNIAKLPRLLRPSPTNEASAREPG